MQTGNPWQEVASVAEAEALTGFGLVLPEPESPYTREVIRVLNREVISVAYMREDSGEIGYELRKEKGETDPSGDFTEYAETTEKRVDGINVTLRGENGRRFLATWTRDGYSYSVEAEAHPLTEQEMLRLVKTVDVPLLRRNTKQRQKREAGASLFYIRESEGKCGKASVE